jgi:hypothetical protein
MPQANVTDSHRHVVRAWSLPTPPIMAVRKPKTVFGVPISDADHALIVEYLVGVKSDQGQSQPKDPAQVRHLST